MEEQKIPEKCICVSNSNVNKKNLVSKMWEHENCKEK